LTDLNQILWNDRTSAKDQSIRVETDSDPNLNTGSIFRFFQLGEIGRSFLDIN